MIILRRMRNYFARVAVKGFYTDTVQVLASRHSRYSAQKMLIPFSALYHRRRPR